MMRHENAVDTNMKSIDTELKWNGASLLLLLGRFAFSSHLYRAPQLVGRFFNTIKQCRRIATRYDKFAGNCLAMADWQPSASGCTLMNPRPSYSSY
jgi:transposase